MKHTSKKILAVLLCMGLLLCSLSAMASAADTARFSVLNYNVAGLPFSNPAGVEDWKVSVAQKYLGAQLNTTGYDIIATQEDFNYNANLRSELTNYAYQTKHMGGVPVGDGMNVYSKFPIYNVERTEWNSRYGIINDGADELTPKGIVYMVIKLADGVCIDFYDIHADAFGDAGSVAARRDNFKQLAAIINARTIDRPVIITGDFNGSLHLEASSGIKEYLIDGCGFKDAWAELKNDGDYEDFSEMQAQYSYYWGLWDSVERFLYKDGNGIELEAEDFEYVRFEDAQGHSFSDHYAASCTFSYTLTDDFAPDTGKLEVKNENAIKSFMLKIKHFIQALIKVLANLEDAIAFLKK